MTQTISATDNDLARALTVREQAIASSLVPFAVSDLDGRLTYVNEAFVRLWRYETTGEIIGQSALAFWRDPQEAAKVIAALQEQGYWQGELVAQCRDGALLDIELSASLIVNEAGQPLAMTASFVDITQRLRSQQALELNQRRLKDAERLANLGHWEWDIETNDLYWSDQVYRIFGLTPQQFGASYPAFLQAVHPEDRELVQGKVAAALQENEPYDIEHRIIRPDGEVRIVREVGEVGYDAGGQPQRMLGAVQDITEAKRAAEQLAFQGRVLQHLGDAIITVDAFLTITSWNDAAVRLYGWPAEEAIGQKIDRLLPTQFLGSSAKEALQQLRRHGVWRGTLRQTTRDGRQLYVQTAISPISSAFNRYDSWVAVNRDVTEMRRQQLEQQKLANALAQTADMVFITNKDGVIEYINNAFTTITGYTRQEALGQTPNILKSGRHPDAFFKDMWQDILEGKTLRLVIINRRKNGEIYYEDRTITPLKNQAGEIAHFIASGRDITEQREAQLALQKSDAFNRAILNSLPSHMVVLDENGVIITANEAWTRFGQENNLEDLNKIGVGANYLEVCRQASGDFSDGAIVTLNGLKAVMTNKIARFDQEYPCPAPGRERWFLLRAAPLHDQNGQIIITHTDITQTKLLERQVEAVYQFGQELLAIQSEDQILRRFLTSMTRLFDFDLVACGLVDEARQELIYEYRLLRQEFSPMRMRFPLSSETGLGTAAIESGQAVYIADTKNDERYVPYADYTAASAYATPIQAKKEILGAIVAESSRPDGFTPSDRRFLDILAQQVGQALQNARLLATEQRQARDLTLLYQASRTITASLEMSEVLESLLAEITVLLEATTAFVLLYDEERRHLRCVAVTGIDSSLLDENAVWPDQSVAGWIAEHKETILIEDAQQDKRASKKIGQIIGYEPRALLAAPLIFRERLLGVIEVISRRPAVFQPHHLQLLESLSGSAAVAVENARLFAAERTLKEHLQQSQARLIQAEKMGALGRLTASIAHEVNNPLQSVQGYLTLVQEELPPTTSQSVFRYLDIVESEIERIAELVKQMREFYRPSQQETVETDVHAVLEGTLTLLNKKLLNQGVVVEKRWGETLPAVLANPNHLRQVFLNLLLNGIEAMTDGGRLYIETSRAEINAGPERRPAVKITFTDTGGGIPPEMMEHLFEPFVSTKKSGSGLGLPISFTIIEAHGGQLEVQNEAGQGTTVSALLPALET